MKKEKESTTATTGIEQTATEADDQGAAAAAATPSHGSTAPPETHDGILKLQESYKTPRVFGMPFKSPSSKLLDQ